ncbi:MAG TPA: phosphate/phosphite/phosphonate ABC transporter substrate-binding protein [Candidatus Ruania gallistercoris]|uniref:Phosphate/phosphite/phosphonate ABC transporter substrate-binding protein n=1 Tax=Candidatus Ruania gallistercoris TaxID=2838746 RepID=A0A9D2EH68_9MICO|nr:phosphate/phosphite/phosphonate ABC transporter substrate-binding protein [Candidatus Ruania gallistercoris]
MKRNLCWAAVGAVAALALTACGSNPNESDDSADGGDSGDGGGQEETVENPETLILGLVPSQEVDSLVEDADALGALISEEIGIPVETFVSESYAALVTAMGTGQAHIGMFGPIALVQAADQSGAEIILQSVRYGSPTYHTQWFTNDPDTYCLDDVVEVTNDDGSVYTFCNGTDEAETGPAGEDALALIEQDTPISMVDASSASGYYYPATQLQRVADLDPLTLNTQFAGGHPNSVLNVASGDYPVGVSFDDARDELVEEDPQIGENVTVFAYSNEIPNDGVAVAGDLSDELTQQISDAMVAVMETEEGAEMYDEVYSIEGLVPADLDALEEAREVEANFADL